MGVNGTCIVSKGCQKKGLQIKTNIQIQYSIDSHLIVNYTFFSKKKKQLHKL